MYNLLEERRLTEDTSSLDSSGVVGVAAVRDGNADVGEKNWKLLPPKFRRPSTSAPFLH